MTRNKDVNNPGNGGKFASPARGESDVALSGSEAAHVRISDARQSSRAGRLNQARCSCGWTGDGFGKDSDGQWKGHLSDVTSELPPSLTDPAERERLAALSAAELRELPLYHADRAAWHETADWAESKGIEPMSQYLGSIRSKSIGELLAEADPNVPSQDDFTVARALLDNYEHFSDSPQFIAEAGGQDKFDAEYSRRAQTYFTLDSRSSTQEQISAAMDTLRTLRAENGYQPNGDF